MSDILYLVYRNYSREERPRDYSISPLYGWTSNKKLLKAFFQQRDPDKYITKLIDDKNARLADVNKIDIVKMKSSRNDDEMYIITTNQELSEFKGRLKKLVLRYNRLSSFVPDHGKGVDFYVELFLLLDDFFIAHMDRLGFYPREITSKYDSIDEDQDYVDEWHYHYEIHSGIFQEMLSVEAFIKVFQNDM